ncbi:Dipeptide transport system permease protein DppC (TC 3.A.1.5.2) [hydrothermal vent metagenome]|uniref:Dipeptide transport system permease protein DppC (TC 3.A.1.5.2) n=1 Tax=hydrothermal vent metagenome TaxID=652676 RepID=A0A3B1CBP7_9ZZZZ
MSNEKEPRTFFKMVTRKLFSDYLAVSGGIIVLILFFVAIFAPLIAPYDPSAIDTKNLLAAPSLSHLCGTDDLGRDVFSRMVYGSRISLTVGFVAVGIATLIGLVIGAVSGYFGGWTDTIFQRFIELMMTIPTFFLILAVIAFLEPSIYNIMIVIGITSWTGVARLVRAEFLTLREREFVTAAKAMGASDMVVIFRHILPNAMSPVLVSATLGVAGAILTESALSFLGIGVQPPTPSWGNMLTVGKNYMEYAWWLSLFPGLAIFITVMGYNLLGEGARDALDPRL